MHATASYLCIKSSEIIIQSCDWLIKNYVTLGRARVVCDIADNRFSSEDPSSFPNLFVALVHRRVRNLKIDFPENVYPTEGPVLPPLENLVPEKLSFFSNARATCHGRGCCQSQVRTHSRESVKGNVMTNARWELKEDADGSGFSVGERTCHGRKIRSAGGERERTWTTRSANGQRSAKESRSRPRTSAAPIDIRVPISLIG